ncbi:CocE/NonD family hydrolase [Listeria monocytogenes]|uniref:CocE/NonD family hydrolase n=1 Tax=Listeria monocytogenes TaxID=1639 RepID=UPI001F091E2D
MVCSQVAHDGNSKTAEVAKKSGSNGKTALTGTSYLAFSKWNIAAEQPPLLTCLNPTEGLAHGHRNLTILAGILEPNFIERLQFYDVRHTNSK